MATNNQKINYFKQCKSSAELGYADSLYELGTLYEYGEGTEKDFFEALECYKQAAEQGHVEAINKLDQLKTNESEEDSDILSGYPLDEDAGINDYEKAINGDAEAQFELAIYYEKNNDSGQKLQLAVELYKKSANQGHAGAQNNLAVMYRSGKGLKKDEDMALELYIKSAKQGESVAQQNLAFIYSNGQIVEQDYKEALKWAKKSALQGDFMSQNLLGYYFNNGIGVDQDYKEAVKWFKKSAKQDYSPAQHNLANRYMHGQGVLKDYEEAIEWYKKAAKQEYSLSFRALGLIYLNGNGVERNFEEAAEWFLKSAKADDRYSQYILFKYADEMKIDFEDSYQFLSASAGNGILSNETYEFDNSNESMIYYKKLVTSGYAKAQYSLGVWHYNQKSNFNFINSKYWMIKAYENSDKEIKLKAQEFWNKNKLWNYDDFQNCDLIEPTYEQKIRYFVKNILTPEEQLLRAIFGENSDGNDFVIAYRLNNGLNVLRDPKNAIKHYKKAFKQGIKKDEVAFDLGVIYFNEEGLKDFSESKKWIKIAYESDDKEVSSKAEKFWNDNEFWKY
jgi:TPR repeat protein